MAALGSALNNMSEELARKLWVLEQRTGKTAGLEHKTRFSRFCGKANRQLEASA